MKTPAINQAMEILRSLRKISESNKDISTKLNEVVKMIVEQMEADAGACYLVVDDNYLEIFAAYGFKENIAHKISLRFGDGLVGDIAQNTRSLSVANAWHHPLFSYKPELGEDNYKSFVGVPLIRWGKSIGVITVQTKEEREFSRSEIDVLETIAMVLSETVSSEEMNEYKKHLIKLRGQTNKEKVKGISLSKGYGLGNAVVHRRRQSVTKIFAEDKEKETKKLDIAYTKMNHD